MASKAFINVMASITLSGYIAELILKKIPDIEYLAKLRRNAVRLREATIAARKLWPLCDRNELEQVRAHLVHMHVNLTPGNRKIEEIISVCLALLSDIDPHLRGARKDAIGNLMILVEKVNASFDKRLDDSGSYEFASKVVDGWYDVIGRVS